MPLNCAPKIIPNLSYALSATTLDGSNHMAAGTFSGWYSAYFERPAVYVNISSFCRAPGTTPASTSSQFAKQEVRARIAARSKQQQQQRQLSQGVTDSSNMAAVQMHMNSSQAPVSGANSVPPPSYSGVHATFPNDRMSFESTELPQHILDQSKIKGKFCTFPKACSVSNQPLPILRLVLSHINTKCLSTLSAPVILITFPDLD